ncbi:phage portal protein [Clostridium chromiireducens]|uniref:Phage portal protein, lambda family n=1 Tax=Clostridium chromiireducens TaxID=225345 RepID=A0A1V4IV78_9CLOT|nr:phage portal protein [Clostridium chromiireducens]OPJ63695.1 phage portal protein, lambda family [Clostridium chromiireducens]
MNALDKVINFVNPQAGLKRELARAHSKVVERFMNTGYSESGASTQKKALKGWNALSSSPEEDIDLNLWVLRNRCRDLYNSPLGRSAIQTTRTNVVGSGLKLKSRIDFNFLGISEDEADEWEQNVEREFALWAESVHCDSCKLNNFYEIQQLAQLTWLQSGDTFAVLKQDKPLPYMPYGLRIALIEADRVSTPNTLNNIFSNGIFAIEATADNGNRIVSGVEIDSNGAVVAYYICNRYPQSFYIMNNTVPLAWTRVEAFGKLTGRRNILHLMESERPEQRRGVPFLAPVIEPLKQLTRYTEAELMAAVVTGMFTVFIKSKGPSSEIPFGSMIPEDQQVPGNDREVNYELAPGAINVLQPDEDVEIANPGRPNTAFDGFVNALCRYVGAALEIPQELLQKSFQSSYSAARAALLEAWKMFRMRREWMSNSFCQPVYEEWLTQAVAMGRIRAPGFFDDPIVKKAWCGAEWNGPAPGQLDPLKEISAAEKRIQNGVSTREQETMEINGGNFDKNIQQAKREQRLMRESGLLEDSSSSLNQNTPKGGENIE